MIPKDPMILLSWVNTHLRDDDTDLDALCRAQDLSRKELESTLAAIGYRYDAGQNRFR